MSQVVGILAICKEEQNGVSTLALGLANPIMTICKIEDSKPSIDSY